MAVFSATGGNPSGSRPNFFGRQHLTFDKGGKLSAFRGIVRFWRGWCGKMRGVLLRGLWEWQYSVQREAIPSVVARIFSGDSTSPLTRDGHGRPKLNAQSFARMRNQQSVHKGAWTPEVERPEFRKDAKPTERS